MYYYNILFLRYMINMFSLCYPKNFITHFMQTNVPISIFKFKQIYIP